MSILRCTLIIVAFAAVVGCARGNRPAQTPPPPPRLAARAEPVTVVATSGDADGDALADADDQCPEQPEDLDHFQDEDGCPDPDNDNDRIQDADDQCPNEPETYNGVRDEDGCPEGCILRIADGKAGPR